MLREAYFWSKESFVNIFCIIHKQNSLYLLVPLLMQKALEATFSIFQPETIFKEIISWEVSNFNIFKIIFPFYYLLRNSLIEFFLSFPQNVWILKKICAENLLSHKYFHHFFLYFKTLKLFKIFYNFKDIHEI